MIQQTKWKWMSAGIAGVLVCAGISQAAIHTKDSLEMIKANVKKETAVFVDVREKLEWDDGHIQGATYLPLSQLKRGFDPERLEKPLPKNKILYVYCLSGARSLTAADILAKRGYTVRPLKQGYADLVDAGFPDEE